MTLKVISVNTRSDNSILESIAGVYTELQYYYYKCDYCYYTRIMITKVTTTDTT